MHRNPVGVVAGGKMLSCCKRSGGEFNDEILTLNRPGAISESFADLA